MTQRDGEGWRGDPEQFERRLSVWAWAAARKRGKIGSQLYLPYTDLQTDTPTIKQFIE